MLIDSNYQSKILEFRSSIGQEGVPSDTVPLLTLLLLEHESYHPSTYNLLL